MKKFISPLFLSCSLWAINDGDTWVGLIPTSDSNITLNSGDNFTITLDRENVAQNRGNNFGSSGSTNLALNSNNGTSTLTLRKNNSLADMQFYHKVGNTISVNQNACLIIDLANSNASDNRFNIFGGVININQGGTLGIRGAYRVSIGDRDGGLIQVNQGGRLKITGVGEIRNIRSANKSNLGIYNNGGEMVLKLDRGIYNTSYDAGTSSFYAGSIVQTSGSTLIAHNDENQDILFITQDSLPLMERPMEQDTH